MATFKVFKRSATCLASWANARKITVDTGLTEDQARERCKVFNENRTRAQVKRGTKLEYTRE